MVAAGFLVTGMNETVAFVGFCGRFYIFVREF
jgi:hypothetical protein